ncbi:uncharacterized protein IL334_002631 [Kwoniella shivajii]|uniref:Uncharacterized protein n=1 Tax=Kwoniella shivajii TaxID=564305 RepID=A0ABZ1CVM9_9TREE|nr:hypothetical protein IL334_002631 [Kwoniella shivajii]
MAPHSPLPPTLKVNERELYAPRFPTLFGQANIPHQNDYSRAPLKPLRSINQIQIQKQKQARQSIFQGGHLSFGVLLCLFIATLWLLAAFSAAQMTLTFPSPTDLVAPITEASLWGEVGMYELSSWRRLRTGEGFSSPSSSIEKYSMNGMFSGGSKGRWKRNEAVLEKLKESSKPLPPLMGTSTALPLPASSPLPTSDLAILPTLHQSADSSSLIKTDTLPAQRAREFKTRSEPEPFPIDDNIAAASLRSQRARGFDLPALTSSDYVPADSISEQRAKGYKLLGDKIPSGYAGLIVDSLHSQRARGFGFDNSNIAKALAEDPGNSSGTSLIEQRANGFDLLDGLNDLSSPAGMMVDPIRAQRARGYDLPIQNIGEYNDQYASMVSRSRLQGAKEDMEPRRHRQHEEEQVDGGI